MRFINSYLNVDFAPNVTMRTAYMNTYPRILIGTHLITHTMSLQINDGYVALFLIPVMISTSDLKVYLKITEMFIGYRSTFLIAHNSPHHSIAQLSFYLTTLISLAVIDFRTILLC
jgi:hypothetical protein